MPGRRCVEQTADRSPYRIVGLQNADPGIPRIRDRRADVLRTHLQTRGRPDDREQRRIDLARCEVLMEVHVDRPVLETTLPNPRRVPHRRLIQHLRAVVDRDGLHVVGKISRIDPKESIAQM